MIRSPLKVASCRVARDVGSGASFSVHLFAYAFDLTKMGINTLEFIVSECSIFDTTSRRAYYLNANCI